MTHKVLNACHVASNKTFFSHRCFRGIFTGQIFRENDSLTSKQTFAFFCLMSRVNCNLFLDVSYSGNFLAPVHMSMKWFSRFSVLFSPMNAAIQISISNTFYSPVSHQFNSRLKEALLNYKLYYKTQWLVQRIFREKYFGAPCYIQWKKFTYDNRQLISFFFSNRVKKCSMQKIPF